MPGTKVIIEIVMEDVDDEEAALDRAKRLFENPFPQDITVEIAAAKIGWTANKFRPHILPGQETRDTENSECEAAARAGGWDQVDGVIFNSRTHANPGDAINDPDGVVYQSWAECCREEDIPLRPEDNIHASEAERRGEGEAYGFIHLTPDIPSPLVPRRIEDFPIFPTAEHPVAQRISSIETGEITYVVGLEAGVDLGPVTRIEATTKSGLHADIPYVRVWSGNVCVAEFCQHNIVGVFFSSDDAQLR